MSFEGSPPRGLQGYTSCMRPPAVQTADFLWDSTIPADRFGAAVNDPGDPDHDAWLALLLREARPDLVWCWTTPDHVAQHLGRLGPRLGRKRAFWEWLIASWRRLGLLR